MHHILLQLTFVALVLTSARAEGPLQASRLGPLTWHSPLVGKNFPLLDLIAGDAAANRQLAEDAALRDVLIERRTAAARAAAECRADAPCHVDAFSWRQAEIAAVRSALVRLAATDGALRRLVVEQLEPSGVIARYGGAPADAMVGRAWEESANGINNVLAVYGLGAKPRYPAIDSVAYDVTSETFGRLVHTTASVLDDGREHWQLFYQPSLDFALQLLRINGRDEAARHEPLHTGENGAAFRRVSSVTWSAFPYTVIVVPGAGADRPDVRLSPGARLRLQLAAKRFREKRAPFLLVSGGYVHPNQTRFNEALEMKRALIEEFGVPEEAILVDPHARHTTTNLRNAARIVFRYGIPADRPSLITTDQYQSEYIESAIFQERCDRELGYRPHELGHRLSAFDLEWRPRRESLHADPKDPLDP